MQSGDAHLANDDVHEVQKRGARSKLFKERVTKVGITPVERSVALLQIFDVERASEQALQMREESLVDSAKRVGGRLSMGRGRHGGRAHCHCKGHLDGCDEESGEWQLLSSASTHKLEERISYKGLYSERSPRLMSILCAD